ncbi:MAG: electron transfer flavoprotein subunit alpha/FixB family protein [Bdellovibrionales bacterium]|nr:electron transfer flavoprotein subunit alpha/FixB family protein [Bdellovibrionales bacterium]
MIVAILETTGQTVPKSALVTIAAAKQAKAAHGYQKAVGVVVGGQGVEAAANEAARFGLDEIVYVQHASLEPYLALAHEAALRSLLEELSPKLVIACATTRGKDLLPRLAARLDAGQASDVIAFLPGGGFRRPMYAGNIIADVEVTSDVKVATVRATAFDVPTAESASCPVRSIEFSGSATSAQQFVRFDTVASERPELTEADVVVSGGRAMKSAENFEQYIAPLADALGAAIGASRAAVDSGYAPNDWQVGQTGKVVAPTLYIAVGISGAIQHLAGMKDSKTIVAINKDAEAPIFEVADYGLVADLYEAVPALTEAIRKAKS